MLRKWSTRTLAGVVALSVVAVWYVTAAPATGDQRARATKAYNDGNFKDAYKGFRKLALDPAEDKTEVGKDLEMGLSCLQRLGRVDEGDEFRELVIGVHKKNWRLLDAAAHTFVNEPYHYGHIVAGKFERGYKRGGGRLVYSIARDRTRALQLMQQAQDQTGDENDKGALGRFYLRFANLLVSGVNGSHEPWRLQYLTDLSQLPDYEQGGRYRGNPQAAPVDAEGNPVFHYAPKSYQASETDGQRWRWMLIQAVAFDPGLANEADTTFADFHRNQFGVQTMAWYGRGFRPDDGKNDKTGPFAVHTLTDNETIAHLATGLKRFQVPDEFNWIKVYQRIAGRGKSDWGGKARDNLASVFENRRQYVRAAQAWKTAVEEYGPGKDNYRSKQLDQIVGNWGRFEPLPTQPAGTKATVDFRFRNGDKVTFEAHAIKVAKLLDDVKAYLRSSPGMLSWEKMNVQDVGRRLVWDNQTDYVGDKVASWDLELKPRPEHVDDRVTVTTPLLKPGAYLLTGQMAGGNTSRVIIWVADTVIVKKALEGKAYYFIADAVSGQPVDKADLEFFGWKQVQIKPNVAQWRVDTVTFNAGTDADGQLILGQDKQPQEFSWLVTATKAKDGKNGGDRFAYLGFTNVWYQNVHDPEYKATKVFTMTDRPVYRPEQTVQFKFWVRHAQYDQPDVSDFAGQGFIVEVRNPKNEKVYEKTLTADEYGGVAGELSLPKGATLGTYGLSVRQPGPRYLGGSTFRVEEYKKPEFEVTVEAPKVPVRLGEKIDATIRAKYYFGAPVTKAKVKYTVLRTSKSDSWYPTGRWDWFYGSGYWWFAADYSWYPGWADWGMRRPVPIWWRGGGEQPEVVAEREVEIGADGTVKVPIDTLPAKELHGNQDHEYTISVAVVDESRRTIDGVGKVLVARQPFKVFAWVDRGYYRAGDTVKAFFKGQTPDQKPVEGKGELTLYRVSYNARAEPVEKVVETWKLDTNVEGRAQEQIKAAEAGQYRLSYKLTDSQKHTIEGGYLFVVRGDGFTGKDYRFNDVELVTDKREYNPGEKVKLLINTNKTDGVVLLFGRPTNGVYHAPKVIRLQGKSIVEEIGVAQKDMPNFYVEALTIADGRVHTEVREVVVPPEKRVLNVEVVPSAKEYKPGEKATVKVKLTDLAGKPFVGSTVLTMYDKAVEYISGGSNVPEIKEFFWKWRRHHSPQTESSLARSFSNLLRQHEIAMNNLGVFGDLVVEQLKQNGERATKGERFREAGESDMMNAAPAAPGMGGFGGRSGEAKRGAADGAEQQRRQLGADKPGGAGPQPPPEVQPAVRKNFADTAIWKAALTTDKDGTAEVSLTMPENLSGWKVKVWGMGHGTKVGQGEAEVVTKKNLLVRLQAPRFFIEKDEVVLSANVHNYLKNAKDVKVQLELDGGALKPMDELKREVKVAANGEQRVDWRVKVTKEGQAIVRMKALTDEESDAVQMSFPCYVHGMLKMDSFSGVIRPDKESAIVTMTVPEERRINETRLEVRYSPTLAGAMVDALPYLVDYPYGCTEQTLNRFLPTVITQRILLNMKLDLKDIQKKRTNLNAQELGDGPERARGWKRLDRNPVFDEAEVKDMAKAGVQALINMQVSDGGWGWFSGWGERSFPHTTAVVVHGLQLAKSSGVELPPGVLEKGVAWLTNYQATQVQRLKNFPTKAEPYKEFADNIDALVYMVLTDSGAQPGGEMREFLYRDRTKLAVYAKAMFGLALHKEQQADKLAMILKNISQFVIEDKENQTAYLKLPADNHWWFWYGSEVEANAYYLKLLSRTSPRDEKAAGLVKYLLNNRKHSTYWNSTRDTAVAIEALAEYLTASGEDRPDMTVEVFLDGKKQKEVKIDAGNLFSFDNAFVLTGDAVESGKRVVEIRRKGTGPVYFNAYLSNFTLEDFITKAGLEVKVNRKYYKLTRVEKTIKVTGSRGQALDQKVEKYERAELANGAQLKSGDLVEVELEIDSKNDYEYLLFEDMKPAGFEALLVRSGYNANDLGAYMEMRDDRVAFFVRALARGKHSVSYRLRAEIPGRFSALPARASAMYAPELKGNSDEIKLKVVD